MINSFRKMSKIQAAQWASEIDTLPDAVFDDLIAGWNSRSVDDVPDNYLDMRKLLVDTYDETVINNEGESKNRLGYLIDLNLGFTLYKLLQNEERFTTVLANDDDIWRFISCKVIPDLTYSRYPKAAQGDERINSKRFYAHTRRIWIKTLWWYIHLSWQGDRRSTYEVLKDFGTDTISDFIERPGRGKGYRLPLFRAMVSGYAAVENKNSNLFNQLSKLNLVKCKTVVPALTANHEIGYVAELIREVQCNEDENYDN